MKSKLIVCEINSCCSRPLFNHQMAVLTHSELLTLASPSSPAHFLTQHPGWTGPVSIKALPWTFLSRRLRGTRLMSLFHTWLESSSARGCQRLSLLSDNKEDCVGQLRAAGSHNTYCNTLDLLAPACPIPTDLSSNFALCTVTEQIHVARECNAMPASTKHA